MNKKIRNEATDGLFRAILNLNSLEECYTFFEDVCTINEIQSLSQRFEVAKLLREKRTYLEIAEQTGASTATISRVNRSLNYGNDGYDMVFRRMEPGSQEKQIRNKRILLAGAFGFAEILHVSVFAFFCRFLFRKAVDQFFNHLFFDIDIKA